MTFATTLTESRRLTPGVCCFRFVRPDGYEFTAGQWFVITIPSDDGPLTKHFTHSSSPTEPFLEFTTRLTGSQFKNALDALPLGTEVQMEGPFGTFVLRDGVARVAFLTGGIGVTPVRSILRYLTDLRASVAAGSAGSSAPGSASGGPGTAEAFPLPEIAVFLGNLSEDTMTFRDELESMAATLPGTRVVHVLSQPSEDWHGHRGYISADIVRGELADPGSWTYYLSGPPPMVEAMRSFLSGFDIPRKQMVLENFEGYAS
jgi:ferredoxin-NADP reductase